jgi:hypothetical protein
VIHSTTRLIYFSKNGLGKGLSCCHPRGQAVGCGSWSGVQHVGGHGLADHPQPTTSSCKSNRAWSKECITMFSMYVQTFNFVARLMAGEIFRNLRAWSRLTGYSRPVSTVFNNPLIHYDIYWFIVSFSCRRINQVDKYYLLRSLFTINDMC